ncbi:MAG: PEGA domain-containing protein [Ignavibacteriaceae bacterium]|nr:PEGA domain-containing protein [Ignavibacteriaceae bacterium]
MKYFAVIVATFLLLFKFGCTDEPPTTTNLEPVKGLIYINSNPSGAEIFLQGTSTGKFTPDSIINLAPNSYDIRIRLNDYADSSFEVSVNAGLKTTVDIDLTGTLSIGSTPSGAEIYLNGITTGRTTPVTFDSLFPDIYEVTLKLEYFMDTSITVPVRSGDQGIFITYSLEDGKIVGVGSLPPGIVGSPEDTKVALYLSIDDWLYGRVFASTTCDGSGNYVLDNVTPGVYYMDAWKDNDNNGIWGSSGDYIWLQGTGIYPNYKLIPIQIAFGAVITIDFELFVVP